MSYRIKMYCTAADELLFNNNKITKHVGNDIITSMMPNANMKEIFILYKYKCKCKQCKCKQCKCSNGDCQCNNNCKCKMCIKSIEFSSNTSLTEEQFISFIEQMQQAGFYSKDNYNIKFIDKNVTVYNYSFQTIQKQHVVKREYKRNTSTYNHISLYKKNSKGIICD